MHSADSLSVFMASWRNVLFSLKAPSKEALKLFRLKEYLGKNAERGVLDKKKNYFQNLGK